MTKITFENGWIVVGKVQRTTSSSISQYAVIGMNSRAIRQDLSVKPLWKVIGMSFIGLSHRIVKKWEFNESLLLPRQIRYTALILVIRQFHCGIFDVLPHPEGWGFLHAVLAEFTQVWGEPNTYRGRHRPNYGTPHESRYFVPEVDCTNTVSVILKATMVAVIVSIGGLLSITTPWAGL